MQLVTREIVSPKAVELYLTATPDLAAEPGAEAERMFAAILDETERRGGRICRLRAFVPEGCQEAYRRSLPADRACTWLHAGGGAPGGVQAHAIAAGLDWRPLVGRAGEQAGWVCGNGKTRWAFLNGLHLPSSPDSAADTRAAFETAERLLTQAGMGLTDVARTWFFLQDILAWYDRFNAGRNQVFSQRGMLGPGRSVGPNVPASTGVGVAPADGARLALECFAVAGPDGCLVRRLSAGRQHSAYEYGVAFARAAEAATPAGRTVFVSGTAAIDEHGKTCLVGDAPGQIRMTLDNVQAVLADTRCRGEDVVQAVAYCKTAAIAERFAKDFRAAPPWPWVICVGDICRSELLFEAEVTACSPSPVGPAA